MEEKVRNVTIAVLTLTGASIYQGPLITTDGGRKFFRFSQSRWLGLHKAAEVDCYEEARRWETKDYPAFGDWRIGEEKSR